MLRVGRAWPDDGGKTPIASAAPSRGVIRTGRSKRGVATRGRLSLSSSVRLPGELTGSGGKIALRLPIRPRPDASADSPQGTWFPGSDRPGRSDSAEAVTVARRATD